MKNSVSDGKSSAQTQDKIIKDTKSPSASASSATLIKYEPQILQIADSSLELPPKQSQSSSSNQSQITEAGTSSSSSENEEFGGPTLREMFPDLPISDENLSLVKLQRMSTTDVTRQIVSLNKPAILKPAVRLIPPDRTWLSALLEVDQGQEAEDEQEIREWITMSDSELSEEAEEEEEEEEGEDTNEETEDFINDNEGNCPKSSDK